MHFIIESLQQPGNTHMEIISIMQIGDLAQGCAIPC